MKELVKYIQGNFGCGWEDESGYAMGYRRKNEKEQTELLKHDLKEYRLSGQGVYRVISRYEPLDN